MLRRKDRAATTVGILPGYTDLVEIGGGAFASVYRAVEEDTGRKVALKILKVDTIHSHLIETFHQEIQALGKVSDHPNIVTLYRPLATPDGRPVLVLELCRESLAQQIRSSGPLSPTLAVRVGIKVAGALETAHRNGFLHRDMKPQNILVTQFGEPALADFGVAALQASAQATAGVFGFTTLHAAPEMLEGHLLSPATDIYGLASTMYQLLSGLAPFAAFDNEAPASVILRIIRDPVRPLRAEGIPIALSDLLEASLSKDPERRPPTAVAFAESLQAIEREAGWVETGYVAWGEPLESDGVDRSRLPSVDTPVATATAAAPPVSPSDLYPTAPSVRVEQAEARLPLSPAPLSPAPLSPAPLNPAPPAATFEPASVEESRAPARSAYVPPPPPPQAPLPPLAPPVPAPPVPAGREGSYPGAPETQSPQPPAPPAGGPSVSAPDPVSRKVVDPGESGFRGQPSLPMQPPPESLAPLRQGSGGTPPPNRPVFVDPDEAGYPAEAGARPPVVPPLGETVYEQTMQVGQLFGTTRPREPEPSADQRREWLGIPVIVLAGVAAAAVVITAAVLLILGVL